MPSTDRIVRPTNQIAQSSEFQRQPYRYLLTWLVILSAQQADLNPHPEELPQLSPSEISMKRSLRTILVAPFRLLLEFWWPILARTHRRCAKKRVLLCADSRLMVEYASDAAKFIRDDPRVTIALTGPAAKLFGRCMLRDAAAELGYRYVPYVLARAQWWDLIIFAEYRAADRYHPDIPKVLVNHFLGGGKIISGKEYRFQRDLTHHGRPLFASIFEASEAERDRAVASDPSLADKLRIVGDLRSDRMLELNASRRGIRHAMGFSESDKVVLIQSTWGPQSIMERCGRELMAEAIRLLDEGKYKFILSTHPHHWHGPRAVQHPWGKFLLDHERLGLVVIRPSDDWARFMVASDLVVTDNTSLSATYCQLQKPFVFIEIPENTIPDGSTVHQLYSISPHFDSPAHLERAINRSLQSYPYDELQQISHQVNSAPGQAGERIQREMYRLLDLPNDEPPMRDMQGLPAEPQ